MKLRKNILAAKVALVLALSTPGVMTPAVAGIPVIDGGNLMQTVLTARESIAQTAKQIEQYKTQLQEYENMLQNTLAPAAYIWDQAQNTMNKLRGAIDTLNYYKNQAGGIDAYLAKFQDVAYYRSSPCFNLGCSKEEWDAMTKSAAKISAESQKKANDAMFKGIDQRQDSLIDDARQLQRLQSAAQGADGQMQALGFANQLASNQTNQLLQIRGLLLAQQNAIATRNQAVLDQESRTTAADEQALRGDFKRSRKTGY